MYTIRLPESSAEYKEGLQLLSESCQEKFGTYPPQRPDKFFLAFSHDKGGKVVGTLGLDY